MVEGDNIYLQLVKFQFLSRHPNMPRISFRCDPLCASSGQRTAIAILILIAIGM